VGVEKEISNWRFEIGDLKFEIGTIFGVWRRIRTPGMNEGERGSGVSNFKFEI
jgi:hypothetical protein